MTDEEDPWYTNGCLHLFSVGGTFCQKCHLNVPDKYIVNIPSMGAEAPTAEQIEALHNEAIHFLEGARRYGGGFVKALADAACKGDHSNTLKIKVAFIQYWIKYTELGRPIVEADQ